MSNKTKDRLLSIGLWLLIASPFLIYKIMNNVNMANGVSP